VTHPNRLSSLARRRTVVCVAVDSLAWAVALAFATWVRYYDLPGSRIRLGGLALTVALAVAFQGVAGTVSGLYLGRWRLGSFDEVAALVRTAVVATVALFLFDLWIGPARLVPRSVPLSAGAVALVLQGAARYGWRSSDHRRRRPAGEDVVPTLVFGAGEGGAQVIAAMLRNPASPYVPVGLLDDDPAKRHLSIMGVPVVGGRDRMRDAAAKLNAQALLIAIPSADAALVSELSQLAAGCDLPVKVLPSVSELLGSEVGVGDIRDVTAADLLGRHEITTDLEGIAEYLTGKRVLVTGAGGSIGSELCRQIDRFAPASLTMVDRDDCALHATQLRLDGRGLLDTPDLVLLDIRDREELDRLLAERRPQVIFHAAALKHLALVERYPAEAVKTNVWATLDLLESAVAHGVERFVNISTDKAADPCSVLGYSKRITERLTAYMSGASDTVCVSVRFGNVLWSRGSVLTTFRDQIDRGGPVTVTDRDVTRYFMTVEEAVQLVIQAAIVGQPGEVLVLDMGDPVKIAEVARLLAARSERPIKVKYTGLRPGEKLEEAVLGTGEVDSRPSHPLISQVTVPSLSPTVVRSIDVRADADVVRAQLEELCRWPASEPGWPHAATNRGKARGDVPARATPH
jgi:FlaA1/EpsC-like NDP-sugar epimerase